MDPETAIGALALFSRRFQREAVRRSPGGNLAGVIAAERIMDAGGDVRGRCGGDPRVDLDFMESGQHRLQIATIGPKPKHIPGHAHRPVSGQL
jgi:hypothetical protein